jgi:uncharacterized protein YqhQ
LKRARIGGQAVIEGVMMKHGNQYAVAVRKPDNEIEVKLEEYTPIGEKYKVLKLPILRGIVNFVESLVIGMKTLTYSADFYEEEEDLPDKKSKDNKSRTDNDENAKGESSKSEDLMMVGTVIISIALAIAIFMLLPAFVAELIGKVVHNHILLSVIEGVIRLAVFVGYVLTISLMKDIQRVFMYHGAEHKSINCFEAGDELTPENIKKHSRYHKRCGTSFLFVVMFVSIVAFMFIKVKTLWMKMLIRVLLVPLIAGISYEFIMYAGRSDSWLANALSKPGMWIQRITTREPDMDMIEVAIKSVEAVIDWREYQQAMRNGEIED